MMGGGFPIDKVRAEAKAAGLEEISCKDSNMVSFAPRGSEAGSFKRLNVYYTTGTVGTCLIHPRQGKTQLIRRKVGLPLLHELMRDPRTHTGIGYHVQQLASVSLPAVTPPTTQPSDEKAEAEARKKLGRLEEAEAEAREKLGRLRREVVDIEAVIASCVQRRAMMVAAAAKAAAVKAVAAKAAAVKRAAAKAAAETVAAAKAAAKTMAAAQKQARKKEEARRLQREEHARRRVTSHGEHFDARMCYGATVKKMFTAGNVTCVATNGRSTIMLYADGDWASTAGLPDALHKTLKGRQSHQPAPVYVSLGSEDRYYIQFSDNTSKWVGGDLLTKQLQKQEGAVRSVAFGEKWDSFFIVDEDGDYSYCGINKHLHCKLEERGLTDLRCVSLGSGGEYYLSTRDGESWWGALGDKLFDKVQARRKEIQFTDFGECEFLLDHHHHHDHHPDYFIHYIDY